MKYARGIKNKLHSCTNFHKKNDEALSAHEHTRKECSLDLSSFSMKEKTKYFC